MTDRAFLEAILFRTGLVVVALVAMTVAFQIAHATRVGGNWERFDDPMSWVWVALAAFFYGFWGYGAILISAISPKKLGRTLFMVCGALYLLVVGMLGFDAYAAQPMMGMMLDAVVVPVLSSVLMIPLFLIIMVIGRVAG